jgi:hypothetical protein
MPKLKREDIKRFPHFECSILTKKSINIAPKLIIKSNEDKSALTKKQLITIFCFAKRSSNFTIRFEKIAEL